MCEAEADGDWEEDEVEALEEARDGLEGFIGAGFRGGGGKPPLGTR